MSELSKKEEDFSRYLYTCPVCDRPFTVVLQHLNTYKECKEKVTETQREELEQTSREYRLERDKRNRKRKQMQDPETFRENAKRRKAKQRERIRTEKKEEAHKKFLKSDKEGDMRKKYFYFRRMSVWFLRYLTHGRIPPAEWSTKCFDSLGGGLVIQEEVLYKEEQILSKSEANGWLMDIDTALLEAVMSLHTLILIPEAKWQRVVEMLEVNEEEIALKEKVFHLIGKLQAGGNTNTKDIFIPSNYQSKISEVNWDAKIAFKTDKLTKEEEILLTDLVAEVLGKEEGLLNRKFQELLDITDVIDNLFDAMMFTSNKHD